MKDLVLSRQAIFDAKMNTVGYEIHIANTLLDEEQALDADIDVFLNEQMPKLVGEKLAVVDCSHFLFNVKVEALFDDDRIIIGVSTEIALTQRGFELIKSLHLSGKRIMLLRYFRNENTELLNHIDYLTIDILDYDIDDLENFIDQIKINKIKVIAARVENYASFELCKEISFDYYQGSFLTCPNEKNSKKSQQNRIVVLNLLNKIQAPDVSVEAIEQSLIQDPKLAYQLLKIINSPIYMLKRKVSSVKEAIIFIGLNQIKRWVSFMALSTMEGKPQELTTTAMLRAKMCEAIEVKKGGQASGSYFTAGLFSTLDALLDKNMGILLDNLSITDDLKDALLEFKGELGEDLKRVIAYEQAEWHEFNNSGDDFQMFSEAYIESIEWVDSIREW